MGHIRNTRQEYPYINENELVRMLDLLSRIRNVCAHNERLFDYNYQKGAMKDSYIHQALNIPKKGQGYKIGKSDLFAVLISLKYLLDKDEFEDLIMQIQIQLDTLYTLSKHIHSNQMRKYMGFPENWRDIQKCPKATSGTNPQKG